MSLDTQWSGACRLDDRGVIRARGDDAASFLQGQLTNDVASLGDDAARYAGYCSPKGRLLATFVVWRDASGDILLACAKDLLAPTLKRLSMYVLRARCRLTDATGEIALWGVVGAPAEALVGAGAVWSQHARGDRTAIRLPDAAGHVRALVAAPVASELDLPAANPLPPDAWRWLAVQSGVVEIEAATVDRFVPQMTNLELVGGVDFRKGCYPGQEVVARSQYRGTTKRRTFLYDAAGAVAHAGDDVHDPRQANEPAGTVAMAAPDPAGAGSSALVELRLAAHGGDLRLGAIDGVELVERALPYALPLDAATDR